MGYYINPADRSKEDWLEANGTRINPEDAVGIFEGGERLPVCLVDNGFFTAAGIAYSRSEVDAFAAPDHRPRVWYSVATELLQPFMQSR